MATSALVQATLDPDILQKAATILERDGFSVADAIRILLTRTANDGTPPFFLDEDNILYAPPPTEPVDPAAYDAWFRARVQEAIDYPGPDIPHEEVKAEFAARRAATFARIAVPAE